MSKFLTAIMTEKPGSASEKELSTTISSQIDNKDKQSLSTKPTSELPTTPSYPPSSKLSTTPDIQIASKKVASIKNKKVDSRRGDRHTSHRIAFNNRLRAELVKEIKHFCIEQGMALQEFVELSAIHFIEYVTTHQKGKLGSMQALMKEIR